MTENLCWLFLTLAFASCAAPVTYSTDYPLTGSMVQGRDGLLSGKIPQGWFSVTEDSLASALSILLIQSETKATLSVRELKLDRRAIQQVGKDGLPLLARISAASRDVPSKGAASDPQEFELHGKRFCAYEISGGSSRSRVVIFSAKGRYFECEARGGNSGWQNEGYNRLFSTQQSFLSSFTY